MYVQGGYLYIEDIDIIKTKTGIGTPKKITGHSFVALIDKDPFTKKGDSMLTIMRVTKSEPIDPFYTLRGEVGEYLIKRKYTRNNGVYQTWEAKEVNYDNFKEVSDTFGGLVDGVANNDTIVEVKSKSMKDYERIKKYGVESEELQGKYYATLAGLTKLNMEWVFFTLEQEEELKTIKNITNYKGCLNYTKNVEVNSDEMLPLMDQAYNYYSTCIQEKRIPVSDISDKVFLKLVNEGRIDFNESGQ